MSGKVVRDQQPTTARSSKPRRKPLQVSTTMHSTLSRSTWDGAEAEEGRRRGLENLRAEGRREDTLGLFYSSLSDLPPYSRFVPRDLVFDPPILACRAAGLWGRFDKPTGVSPCVSLLLLAPECAYQISIGHCTYLQQLAIRSEGCCRWVRVSYHGVCVWCFYMMRGGGMGHADPPSPKLPPFPERSRLGVDVAPPWLSLGSTPPFLSLCFGSEATFVSLSFLSFIPLPPLSNNPFQRLFFAKIDQN